MANKRIELQHYKRYTDLFVEEPNRKRVRSGVIIVAVTAILLVVFLFMMGILSNDLSKNPRNVLERPPEPTPAAPTTPEEGAIPQGEMPFQPEAPPVEIPGGETPVPPQSYEAPLRDTPIPQIAKAGVLLAQQPSDEGQALPPTGEQAPVEFNPPETQPPSSAVQEGAEEDDKGKKEKGPGEETKGIGNLSNLSTKVSGRGFQLYLLVISVCLILILYLAIRRVRKQGKSQ